MEADEDIHGEATFVLEREDAGAGRRWSLPSDGVSMGRASRIVTVVAGILFVGGAAILFASPKVGSDLVINIMTGAWIIGIVLALAAAHWRAIAGEPTILEVQPEYIQLFNPAQLWGRTQQWKVAKVRKLVVSATGRTGTLTLHKRWRRPYLLLHGLAVAELHEVADCIAKITGLTVQK